MNYVLFNEDGSILKEHIEYYVMKGDSDYTSYFFSRPDFLGSDIAIAYFTLPSGETTTIACLWKEKNIEGVAYQGWEFTLNETTTHFSGLLYASLEISRNKERYLTYPLAIVINDTGYSPFSDSGLTIEEVNSYLKQIQQYQIKYDINNVRGYKSMEEVHDLKELVVGQLVCVDGLHYYVALNSNGEKYLKVLSIDEGSPLIFDNEDISHITGYKEVGNAKNMPYTLEKETDNTTIEGYGNFSYGFNNTLTGTRNVAFGEDNHISGKHNLVGGEDNYISMQPASIYTNPHNSNIIWGKNNVIAYLGGMSGNAVFGNNNSVYGGANNLVVGSHHDVDTQSNATILGTASKKTTAKELLVVGNGTPIKRYNVFEITKDNEIYVDNVEIAKTLTSKENNDLTKYDFIFYKPKNTDTTATNEFKSMPVSIAWDSALDKYDFSVVARDNLGHAQVVAPSTYINDTHDNCIINKGWLLTYIKNNILPKFGGLFVYKGQKQKYSDLPNASENAVGDTWNVVESAKVGSITYPAGSNFVWNGSSWDALGGEQAITQEDLDKKLDKVSTTATYERVYAITENGSQQMLNVDSQGSYNSIAKRTTNGYLVCDYTPNADNQLANKKYVDQMSGFTLREWE